MGDTFSFWDAKANFDLIDMVLKYIRNQKEEEHIEIFYSTPTRYLEAVKQELKESG